MGKVAEKLRTYKKDWESMPWAKGWLTKADEKFFNEAYCKICNKDLRAHRSDLEKHTKTATHVRKMRSITEGKQSTLTSTVAVTFGQFEKNRDLKLAMYVASHTSINSIDHLCDLLVNLGKNTIFENFKMHRTKCSNLIKNVIAPCMLSDLIDDIGDKSFSLIVDESTDVSTFKYLCLCVKYFSEKFGTIITDYLGMIVLEKATADALYDAVINFCADIKLKLENIVGIGTDGGSNLCGKNHSLYALLKQKYNKLQLLRCINHAVNNVASKSATEFPANIDFLCREIFKWFSHSSLRKAEYRRTWEILNSNLDENGETKPFREFVKLSDTRWLVQYFVVNNLLEHWFELQTHFRAVVEKEKCYTARLLNQMLDDDLNLLYLTFLRPILFEVNRLNKIFQADNVDLGRAVEDLHALVLFVARKILKPTFLNRETKELLKLYDNDLAHLNREQVDFGIEYYQALGKCNISVEQRIDLENRALAFLKRLFYEMGERLPENLQLFEGLKSFSPNICLSQTRPRFKDLPLIDIFIDKSKLGLVETQWHKLLTIQWNNHLEKSVLKKPHTFWPQVYSFEDAAGTPIFRDLASYALTLLSLPSSNAVVERVFSVMNLVKPKLRNKMGVPMLDALLRIRCRFHATKTCCSQFSPTQKMFENFNYKVVYSVNNNNDDEGTINNEIFEILDEIELRTISISEF